MKYINIILQKNKKNKKLNVHQNYNYANMWLWKNNQREKCQKNNRNYVTMVRLRVAFYFIFQTFCSSAKLVISVFNLLFFKLLLRKTFSCPSFEVTSSRGKELKTKMKYKLKYLHFISFTTVLGTVDIKMNQIQSLPSKFFKCIRENIFQIYS